MISRLKDGSVLLNSDECMLSVKFNPKTGMLDAFTDADFKQHHGMIFFNQAIYHSQAGEHIEGVRSHPAARIMTQNVLGAYLGSITVLECIDENLRHRFIETMSRWDPVDLLQKLRNAPRDDIDNDTKIKLPTPFMNSYQRRQDPEEQSAKCELFRAIRAYQRNHVEPPLPLSSKGVACGNFIFYSFKAAIVDALFPDGLPEEIMQKIAQIDAVRSENKAARKSNHPVEPMKLADVSKKYPYLDELMLLVEKHISPAQRRHFEFLQAPVKGTNVNDFCKLAVTFPEFWQPTGVLFGYKDKDADIPYVMHYAAYQAFRKPDIVVKRVTDFLLSEQRVEKTMAEITQVKPVKTASTAKLFDRLTETGESDKSLTGEQAGIKTTKKK